MLNKEELSSQYTALMLEYAEAFEEAPLLAIEQLGKEMVRSKMPPEEIGEIHDAAICKLIEAPQFSAPSVRAASLPLMELLMAYGVAFREAQARDEAEQALIDSDQLHREVMSCAFDAIIIADGRGEILEANRAAADIFGYPADGWRGVKITALIPVHLRQRHEDGFRRAVGSGESTLFGQCVQLEALHRDGHLFQIELSLCKLNRGRSTFMATIRDISERKRAEESVRKLSSAIEQSGESVIITDRDGVIEYANPAFTSVTGYSADEAIGQTPRLIKSGNEDDSFYEGMWKTIMAGDVWHGKVIDRRKDGSFYPAMLTISPITNESGDVTCFVGTQSDLSQLEDMEQRFHQAQKMEAIGTMVGGIAHNFNNMLAGMTGNIYLAKQRVGENPDVAQKLVNVEKLAHHAAEMIQQLLTFARKGMVSMEEMPLMPFISETLIMLHTLVPENISVRQNVCDHDLLIKGDGTQLHQVLVNLVSNARDAVEGVDEPRITIGLDTFDADEAFLENHPDVECGTYAHLSIEDNGIGIPEQQLEHLFEPFFTTKEQGKGTGLGLSMVYGALKTHGGFVDVDSTEGRGSTFHIYIPLLEKEVTYVADPVQKTAAAEGRGELILLADDEQIIRDIMAEILDSLGYKVLQAEDGVEAMELFNEHHEEIALAILDVVMPHCGGMALAKRIRAVNPDVPVLFLTGYDKAHMLGGEEPLTGSEVLTKPVNFDLLSNTIRHMLD